mmetsp:Transcript_97748/g.273568  ORF Transcript_97748/g.273568 Transcript_97748/m.273568 type:complete len:155 (+) Transcript_97748:64-528(+)
MDGRILRLLASRMDRHPQGLAIAVRHHRGRLPPWVARRALQLDAEFGVVRHVTQQSCDALEDAIIKALAEPDSKQPKQLLSDLATVPMTGARAVQTDVSAPGHAQVVVRVGAWRDDALSLHAGAQMWATLCALHHLVLQPRLCGAMAEPETHGQ